jgi:predicted nucleic acid-binding protein
VRTYQLDAARGREALEDLIDFPLTRYPHDLFLLRIWELRHNVTAYDAAYIALAEALGIPLLTRDAALASASGNHAHIELV